MAKRRERLVINDFSGGLNNNASLSNLQPAESSRLTNLKTDQTGSLRTIRDSEKAFSILNDLPDFNSTGGQEQALRGRGIFGHGSDKVLRDNGSSAADNSNEYIIYHTNPEVYSVDVHSRINKAWIVNKIQLTKADNTIPVTGKMEGAFYVHNGTTRVCDSNFSHDVEPMWHGYVKKNLYQNSSGESKHTINKWVSSKATMKSFSDLDVSVNWADTTAESVTSAQLDTLGRIVLGISEAERVGAWNGKYKFGITPMYFDGQEGPISECGQINADGTSNSNQYIYLDRSAIQIELYICTGVTGIITENQSHLAGDERIEGLRAYVQRQGDDNWYMLFSTDLEDGDDATNWMHSYSGDDDKAKCKIASGNITGHSWGNLQGGKEHSLTVRIDKGTNYVTFNGKTFTLQLSGFYMTPVSTTFIANQYQDQDIVLTVTNPPNDTDSDITYTFNAILLNDNKFPIMMKKIEKAITASTIQPTEKDDEILADVDDYKNDCFVEGTKILMSDGSEKNIEDIVEDDLILSFDEKTESFVSGIVTEHLIHPVGREVPVAIVGGILEGTPSHPIFFNGGWSEINESEVDTKIFKKYIENYYNLEVDAYDVLGSSHNYIANGYVVSGLGDNDVLNDVFKRQKIFQCKEESNGWYKRRYK
jgi:hypothetical protein